MRFTLCMPTLNAEPTWPDFIVALRSQSVRPAEVIVIDSESADGTANYSRPRRQVSVVVNDQEGRIPSREGAAVGRVYARITDVLVFHAQDAILANAGAVGGAAFSF